MTEIVTRSTRERESCYSVCPTGQGNRPRKHLRKYPVQGEGTLEFQKCPELKRSSINERWQLARESRLCFNCLRPANSFHFSIIRRQPKCCAEWCGQRHHRLLHRIDDLSAENQIPTTISEFVVSDSNETQQILLQTAGASLVGDGGL